MSSTPAQIAAAQQRQALQQEVAPFSFTDSSAWANVRREARFAGRPFAK